MERVERTMAIDTAVETYNYANFGPVSSASDFAKFREHMKVGDKAPDFPATLLDTGETVQLSSYWEDDQDLLVEFGSLT
jgi:hypothetical protein